MTVQLTPAGAKWARANEDSIVANVALHGDGWPTAFVETSREVANEEGEKMCQWFLLCTNPATTTTPHPVLGQVPTCARCNKFASQ